MIDEKQMPIIMDFGLARREATEVSRMTETGAILGTPCYMPIEQVQGKWDKIGPHTDVYSLGVILYELLTGTLPFEGSALDGAGADRDATAKTAVAAQSPDRSATRTNLHEGNGQTDRGSICLDG